LKPKRAGLYHFATVLDNQRSRKAARIVIRAVGRGADRDVCTNRGGFAIGDCNRRGPCGGDCLRRVIRERIARIIKRQGRRAERCRANLDAIGSIRSAEDSGICVGPYLIHTRIVPNDVPGRGVPDAAGRINGGAIGSIAGVPS